MASEPQRDRRDLVALYAQRLRCRSQDLPVLQHPLPTSVGHSLAAASAPIAAQAPAVRQFGRRPAPPVRRARPAGSRRDRPRRSVTLGPLQSLRWQRAGAISAIAATALLLGTQAAAAAPASHQVQPGDTLWSIAQQYHTTVPQLATINGLKDPSLIVVGSNLSIEPNIPSATGATTSSASTQQYTVKSGDTLDALARQFGATVASLVQSNDIADPNLITVGAVLSIPAPQATTTPSTSTTTSTSTSTQATPSADGAALHLVAPGETLGSIAKLYGISVNDLAQANGISDVNLVEVGSLLRVPGTATVTQSGTVELTGMPTQRQSLPLSCEADALSIATAYWGNQVSEWTFIQEMPSNPNPHLGFRGSMNGSFGGTTDYGVYAEPLVPLLKAHGFQGNVFYAEGNADLLKAQLKAGHPVIAWITNMTSVQTRSYQWVNGQRFALVPQEHTVVVYGYDSSGVKVVDPGDGAYRTFSWADFLRSWGYFDGMSLAVYPA